MRVRGKLLEIDAPTPEEREFIARALQDPAIHVPLGCAAPPSAKHFAADLLTLTRGAEVREEPVRWHILRRRDTTLPVGFFVDFGWDHPRDGTREIDLAFPDPRERSLAAYHDATVIVSQYLFRHGLAKRLRWRVRSPSGAAPLRTSRQGARVVQRQEERHPVTGEWMVTYICEFALTDLEELGRRFGLDPLRDYADQEESVWEAFR